ncbi:MAG: glycosyltransferase family 2 protein [Candidatus Aenigmarchaeota archaeon]|nr:glycosyltransferase family 2 protein [Candidatus Aenigmarchaeota archaeon]
MIGIILSYIAWYMFIFIAVAWMLILLENEGRLSRKMRLKYYPMVSVIIPAFNEEETISKTVESVLSVNYPRGSLEVIVVDDGSTDGTGKIASLYHEKGLIKLISSQKNMGKATALNKGIELARGEFIACMDADSAVEKDIIIKLLPYFEDKRIASVSPALKVWRKTNFLEKIQYSEYLLNIFLRKMLALIDSVFVTPGVFSVYRKEALVAVGGFDEGNITEDMEIAFRLQDKGYRLEADLDALSYTLCPRGLMELLGQRLRWYRGGIKNMIKYRHMFFGRDYGYLGNLVLPVNFASAFLVCLIFTSLLIENISNLANFAWNLYLVNFDFSTLISRFDLWKEIEAAFSVVLTTPLILGLMAITISSGLLYISFQATKDSVRKNKAGYFGYMLILPTLLMAVWAAAFASEILGMKRKW